MPELPEVETIMQAMRSAMEGRMFTNVWQGRDTLRIPIPADLPEKLCGRICARIMRRGKYILIFLDDGRGLALHLGMSGRIILTEGARRSLQKHDHLRFDLSGDMEVVFHDPRRFGMIFEIAETGWAQHKAFAAMGVEPFSDEFDGALLWRLLQKRKGPVKTVLLDQRLVAGIGNIYACEALFEAGVSPFKPACAVTGPEAEALAAAIRNVLKKAIAAGGSSLRDYRQADGALGYFQHGFSVYDREGSACPCGGPGGSHAVMRVTQGGRSTFYCPVKQV